MMAVQITKRSRWLIAFAGGILAYVIVTSDGDDNSQKIAVSTIGNNASSRTAVAQTNNKSDATLVPIIAPAERVTAKTNAKQIFAARSWYEAPKALPPPPPPPPAAPTAPPIPYTVMGSYLKQGSARVFFLARGDTVFDVKVGDTLEGTYSVDDYSNGQLLLTYKPLQIQQSLVVGGGS